MGKKFFFDTEFFEDGSKKPIQFISIGIVSEDGDEYYAVSSEFDENSLSDWLKENVVPKLGNDERKLNKEIAKEVVEFVGKNPVFFANFGSYDWVVLCQLYGAMIDLPKNWPMFVRDLQQLKEDMEIENDDLPRQDKEEEHNALSDAKHDKEIYEYLINKNKVKKSFNLSRINISTSIRGEIK